MKRDFIFIGKWDAEFAHQTIKTALGHLNYSVVSVKIREDKFFNAEITVVTIRNFLDKETMQRILAQ